MSKIKYHLDFSHNEGSTESYDLDELKGIRDEFENKGIITVFEITHFIEDDPKGRTFDSWEEAHAALPSMGEGEFFISSSEKLMDPQPKDIN